MNVYAYLCMIKLKFLFRIVICTCVNVTGIIGWYTLGQSRNNELPDTAITTTTTITTAISNTDISTIGPIIDNRGRIQLLCTVCSAKQKCLF